MNFDLAQRDADRIKQQADNISELEKTMALDRKLVKREKMQIVKDMNKRYNALAEEFDSYRKYSECEIDVCHAVIDRQK